VARVSFIKYFLKLFKCRKFVKLIRERVFAEYLLRFAARVSDDVDMHML
jgi:hypothetical protein